jgi:hypothetical protein
MKKILTSIVLLFLVVSAQASDDILDQKKYLKSALGQKQPEIIKLLM